MLATAVEKKMGLGLGGRLVVSLTSISSKNLLLTSSSIVLVLQKMFMEKEVLSHGAGSIETFVNRLSSLSERDLPGLQVMLERVEQNLPE
jgi:hypothetical protein